MENTNTEKSLFDISFDENVKQNLRTAAGWGGIAAIVSIAGSILSVVNYFVQRGKISSYRSSYNGIRVQQTVNTSGFLSVALSLIIGIVLFVFLFKFSNKAKEGVATNDQYLINEGLGSLSVYFRFIGVLFILVIVLVALVIMAGIGSRI